MFEFLKRHKREAIRARPFPEAWRAIIDANVAYAARLDPEERRELEGHVQVFLEEKSFEGCGGLELTDEIKVTIAAQACVLLLHREDDYFPELESILVYPSAYVARRAQRAEQGVVLEADEVRLGESWHHGIVVLAWDSVLSGVHDARDGHNVVLHEFAHQLDQEDGSSDGAPPLPTRSMYASWARVLGADYAQLQNDELMNRGTVIDKYGAKNPAEFFAVVTEAFFEKPRQLAARHPELYAQLRLFYKQDPAAKAR
jgi:Mlc titration factor MtfA (ptsG expression regulator)